MSRNSIPLFNSKVPGAARNPTPIPARSAAIDTSPGPRLDVGDLDKAVAFYFAKGLALSNQRSYESGYRRYVEFYHAFSVLPAPVDEQKLCTFTSYLATFGLKHRTVKVYLSGIRFHQIKLGLHNPFLNNKMERQEYVLRGIKRDEAERQPRLTKQRLPITPDIFIKLKLVCSAGAADTKMIWAACCLGFFAFLRASEFTVPSDSEYDAEVHLGRGDLAMEDPGSPSFVRVCIKQSKTARLLQLH